MQLKAYMYLDPAAKLFKKTEFPQMVKELLDSFNPKEHLPKAIEKCGLVPLNRQKVLESLLSTAESNSIACYLDSALPRRLEVQRFGEGTKKKPRGKKVLAGQSYSAGSEGEQVDDEEEQEVVDNIEGENGNMAVEESEEAMSQEEDDDKELLDLGPSTSRMASYVVATFEGGWVIVEVRRD